MPSTYQWSQHFYHYPLQNHYMWETASVSNKLPSLGVWEQLMREGQHYLRSPKNVKIGTWIFLSQKRAGTVSAGTTGLCDGPELQKVTRYTRPFASKRWTNCWVCPHGKKTQIPQPFTELSFVPGQTVQHFQCSSSTFLLILKETSSHPVEAAWAGVSLGQQGSA